MVPYFFFFLKQCVSEVEFKPRPPCEDQNHFLVIKLFLRIVTVLCSKCSVAKPSHTHADRHDERVGDATSDGSHTWQRPCDHSVPGASSRVVSCRPGGV